MQSQRKIQIRVGLFLIVSLFLGATIILKIGEGQQTFEQQVALFAAFQNVSGLQEGSEVRLNGLKIGVVDRIWIPSPSEATARRLRERQRRLLKLKAQKPQTKKKEASICRKHDHCGEDERCVDNKCQKLVCQEAAQCAVLEMCQERKCECVAKRCQQIIPKLHVRMKVKLEILQQIREDSVAKVVGKGILGNSVIDISIGLSGKSVKPNSWIPGASSSGLGGFIKDGKSIMVSLRGIMIKIDDILKQYQRNSFAEDLKEIIHSVRVLLDPKKNPGGLVHDVLYDKRLARKLQRITSNFERTSRGLASTSLSIAQIVRRSKRKGGLVHRVFMSKQGTKIVREAEEILASIRKLLKTSEQRGKLLYTVFHGKGGTRLMRNLVASSKDLRKIVKDIKDGKGSLGAMIKDPTAFEDFKTILGQVKRSRVFKGLIRFIIQRDDSEKGGRVRKP